MISYLLSSLLYVGARDQDVREAQAQREVEEGRMTPEEASKEYSRSGRPVTVERIKQRIEESKPQEYNVGRGAEVQKARSQGRKVESVGPGVYQIESRKRDKTDQTITQTYVDKQISRSRQAVPKYVKVEGTKEVTVYGAKQEKVEVPSRAVSSEVAETPEGKAMITLIKAGYDPVLTKQRNIEYPIKGGQKIVISQYGQVHKVPVTAKVSGYFPERKTVSSEPKSDPLKVEDTGMSIDPQLVGENRPEFNERASLDKLERDIEAQAQRQNEFFTSPGMKRIEQTASILTLGNYSVISDRSFFGKYSQYVVQGFLGFPFYFGGAVAIAGEKAKLTGQALALQSRSSYDLNIVQTYKETFTDERFLKTFNPLTPEGLATYTFAIGGGLMKGYAKVRTEALKPVTESETYGQMLKGSESQTKVVYQDIKIETPAKSGTFKGGSKHTYKVTMPSEKSTVWTTEGKGYVEYGIRYEAGSMKGVVETVAIKETSVGTFKIVTKQQPGQKAQGEIYTLNNKYVGKFTADKSSGVKVTEKIQQAGETRGASIPRMNIEAQKKIYTQVGVSESVGTDVSYNVVTEVQNLKVGIATKPLKATSSDIVYDLKSGKIVIEPYNIEAKEPYVKWVDYTPKPETSELIDTKVNIGIKSISDKTKIGERMTLERPDVKNIQETRVTQQFQGRYKKLSSQEIAMKLAQSKKGQLGQATEKELVNIEMQRAPEIPASAIKIDIADIFSPYKPGVQTAPNLAVTIPKNDLSEKYDARVITEPKTEMISKTENKINLKQQPMTRVFNKIESKAEVKSKINLKNEVKSKVKSEIIIESKSEVETEQKQEIKQEIMQEQKVLTEQVVTTPVYETPISTEITEPVTTVPPPPTILPPVSLSAQPGMKKYEAFVRKKGRFIYVGSSTDKAEAVRLAKANVQMTASASFKIKGDQGYLGFQELGLGKIFRGSKKERAVAVQRRKFRISSPGEKKEITAKGLLAISKKRKKSIFKL